MEFVFSLVDVCPYAVVCAEKAKQLSGGLRVHERAYLRVGDYANEIRSYFLWRSH